MLNTSERPQLDKAASEASRAALLAQAAADTTARIEQAVAVLDDRLRTITAQLDELLRRVPLPEPPPETDETYTSLLEDQIMADTYRDLMAGGSEPISVQLYAAPLEIALTVVDDAGRTVEASLPPPHAG